MNARSSHPASSSRRGFTLVEIIVSVGLFTVVVTIASSAYLSMIALDRRARATNDLVSNLSFVVGTMARSIRTGTHYQCGSGTNCVNGGTYFSFTNESCQSVMYLRKSDGTVGECIGPVDTSGQCSPSRVTCTDSSAITLTDPRIQVTNLMFYAQGIGLNDGKQPHATFTLSGSIRTDPNTDPVTFTIEGGAAQRIIDL